MMRHCIAFVGAYALVMVDFSCPALSQPVGRIPQLPHVMPIRLVSDVPRLFQVYGAIEAPYRDSIDGVDSIGQWERRDTLLKRNQCGSFAPSISGDGDTTYAFSTLGILVIDVPESPHSEPATFVGRNSITGEMIELDRFLGFWQGADSSTWTPPDSSTDRRVDICAYPNPFTNLLSIRLSGPHGRIVAVRVYTVDGVYVSSLSNQGSPLPQSVWIWDGRDGHNLMMPSGCYVVQVLTEADGFAQWIMKAIPVIKI